MVYKVPSRWPKHRCRSDNFVIAVAMGVCARDNFIFAVAMDVCASDNFIFAVAMTVCASDNFIFAVAIAGLRKGQFHFGKCDSRFAQEAALISQVADVFCSDFKL